MLQPVVRKSFSLFLCLVYSITQVIGARADSSTVWESRRKPVTLAALPAASSFPFKSQSLIQRLPTVKTAGMDELKTVFADAGG